MSGTMYGLNPGAQNEFTGGDRTGAWWTQYLNDGSGGMNSMYGNYDGTNMYGDPFNDPSAGLTSQQGDAYLNNPFAWISAALAPLGQSVSPQSWMRSPIDSYLGGEAGRRLYEFTGGGGINNSGNAVQWMNNLLGTYANEVGGGGMVQNAQAVVDALKSGSINESSAAFLEDTSPQGAAYLTDILVSAMFGAMNPQQLEGFERALQLENAKWQQWSVDNMVTVPFHAYLTNTGFYDRWGL